MIREKYPVLSATCVHIVVPRCMKLRDIVVEIGLPEHGQLRFWVK